MDIGYEYYGQCAWFSFSKTAIFELMPANHSHQIISNDFKLYICIVNQNRTLKNQIAATGKRMEKAMPEVLRQVAVYERRLKLGKLNNHYKAAPQFKNG